MPSRPCAAVLPLQLRLADGSRMVARFNTTHTVGDIRRFILASRCAGKARQQAPETGTRRPQARYPVSRPAAPPARTPASATPPAPPPPPFPLGGACRPDMTFSYQLATAFPAAGLTDNAVTLEGAGLLNAVIIQKK